MPGKLGRGTRPVSHGQSFVQKIHINPKHVGFAANLSQKRIPILRLNVTHGLTEAVDKLLDVSESGRELPVT